MSLPCNPDFSPLNPPQSFCTGSYKRIGKSGEYYLLYANVADHAGAPEWAIFLTPENQPLVVPMRLLRDLEFVKVTG